MTDSGLREDTSALAAAVIDPALAPFAKAPAALAFSADGRNIVWGTEAALSLFGGAAPVPTPKPLAAAIARVFRAIGGSGVATLADLPLPNAEVLMSCACRLVRREDDEPLLVAVPLGALPSAAPLSGPHQQSQLEPSVVKETSRPEAAEPPVPADLASDADHSPLAPVEASEPDASAPKTPAVVEEAASPDAPPPSPTTPLEALRARADGRGIVRFIWQCDANGRIHRASPDLAAIVGSASAAIKGRSITDIVAALAPENAEALAARLTRGETVSAARTYWPVDGGGVAVPVDLSAMPIVEAGQKFQGFRGFGLIRVAEAEAREAPQLPPPLPDLAEANAALETEAKAAPGASIAAPQASEMIDDVEDAKAAWEAHLLAEAEREKEEQRVAEVELRTVANQPGDVEPPAPDAKATPIAASLSPASQDEPTAADEAVTAPTGDKAPPAVESPRQPPTPAGEAPIQKALPPSAPIIPFRRNEQPADTPPAKAAPLLRIVPPSPPPATQAPGSLSSNERRAFRDIARALGARVEDEDLPPSTSDVEATAGDSRPGSREAATPVPANLVTPAAYAIPAAQSPTGFATHAVDILDRLPVGVLVSRGERILYANRTLLDLLDYDDIAAIDAHGGLRNLFKSRSPDTVAEFAAISPVLLAARGGETLPVDARIQSLDWEGGRATLMTVRRAAEGEHGQRLKSTELELRAREADLRETRSILDTATDGVAVLDERGRVLSLNRAAEALFGYDQKEVAGEPFTVLLAPESHIVAIDYLEGLKSGGVRSVLNDGREVVGRVRQGGPQPLFMTIGQIGEAPERKFCAVLRDLAPWKKSESELVAARKAAERANAQKSDFLARISHEIRTPLNAMIGFAEVMMEERFGPVGNARYKDYLRDIHGSGQHVVSLVNDLLDLSKVEAGRLEMNFAAVDVNAVVTNGVALLQPQAQQGRIVVRTSLSRKLPQVVADQRSLKQIVLNVLTNAVKFTDPGGQVIVSTGQGDAGEVTIRVRDTGIGMTDDEVRQALEPFRQLHTARRAGGTGLGLPLTKALVEANRATLRITSAKDEGTLVEIVFPPTRVLAE